MLLTVRHDSSAQPPWSELMVNSVMEATWLDNVLTSRLDTARFWKVALLKVKPSIVLTVRVLIEALFILNVLKDPALP